jgi:hypothetical protein
MIAKERCTSSWNADTFYVKVFLTSVCRTTMVLVETWLTFVPKTLLGGDAAKAHRTKRELETPR